MFALVPGQIEQFGQVSFCRLCYSGYFLFLCRLCSRQCAFLVFGKIFPSFSTLVDLDAFVVLYLGQAVLDNVLVVEMLGLLQFHEALPFQNIFLHLGLAAAAQQGFSQWHSERVEQEVVMVVGAWRSLGYLGVELLALL